MLFLDPFKRLVMFHWINWIANYVLSDYYMRKLVTCVRYKKFKIEMWCRIHYKKHRFRWDNTNVLKTQYSYYKQNMEHLLFKKDRNFQLSGWGHPKIIFIDTSVHRCYGFFLYNLVKIKSQQKRNLDIGTPRYAKIYLSKTHWPYRSLIFISSY